MEATSKKWTLNSIDWQRWFRNAMVFIAPLMIIYLGSVIENIKDGLDLVDFGINSIVAGALVLYALNTMLDLFRKLAQDNTKR